MKKIISVCIAAGITVLANAQINITCGKQFFTIDAKKISSVKQIDPQTKIETTTNFYYNLTKDKLQVWMETKDNATRSFATYEIDKKAIDAASSQEIAGYDLQEYTAPVQTLYIKCAAGKKEVFTTSYVDWTESADKFSWSFIYISSYNKADLEKLLAEINFWLKL